MNITKWLASHPILAVWGVTIVALLMSFGGKDHSTKVASNGHVEAKAEASHSTNTHANTEKHGNAMEQVAHKVTPAAEKQQVQVKTSETSSTNVAAVQMQKLQAPTMPVMPTSASVATHVNTQQAQSNNVATTHANAGADMQKLQAATTPAVVTTDANTQQVQDSNTATTGANAIARADMQKLQAATTPAVVTTDANTQQAQDSNTATTGANAIAASATESSEQSLPKADLADKSTDDLLLMAREAYWNNGLDEAASIYQELIQREPNVIGHKGELGNVYWRQGFPEKSAALYADIAIPMIDNGNAERVSNMIGFIGLFYPKKAAEISKHMQSLNK